MKYLLILLFCLMPLVSWGEGKLLDVCDVCLKRFYEIQGYELCEKCFEKYRKEGKIRLHPSRYCGPWCAHSPTKDGTYLVYDPDSPTGSKKIECSFKDKPKYIEKFEK